MSALAVMSSPVAGGIMLRLIDMSHRLLLQFLIQYLNLYF